jgi:hypothetical protein
MGLAAVAFGMAAVVGTLPAQAWERDRVYADSFGNLVIESAAGYKRILVGEGHEAGRLADYLADGETAAAVTEPSAEEVPAEVAVVDECYRPPVLVKGRSYMYGFDEGVIPLQGGPCE